MVISSDDIYNKLALHLDNLPGGFPATDSGVEMRILRRLFTPKEAQLALHLTFMPKESRIIAQRANMDPDETCEQLEHMVQKGLVFRLKKEGRPPLYGAAQYVIGIWEYQVNNLDSELIQDMNAYASTLLNLKVWEKAPQLRTIPVGRSLKVEHHIFPHEEMEVLVRSQEKYPVGNFLRQPQPPHGDYLAQILKRLLQAFGPFRAQFFGQWC